ncbi:hypothetical protein [Allorhizocola rhizosphaerae]|uniref:hypothetical protein n=1 Tax=Allorhizocola rhizosphaerae TaxID=1872709 RepID=UPI0013C34602|nr:hypothetical protein [Allorhizocola rhizosphaerae]
MMRTRLAKVLLTASMVMAPVIGAAAPANAIPASWHKSTLYSTLLSCQQQGRKAVDNGNALDWQCPREGSGYRLWLYY